MDIVHTKTSFASLLGHAPLVCRERILVHIKTVHYLALHVSRCAKLFLIQHPEFVPSDDFFMAVLYLLNKDNEWRPRNAINTALKQRLQTWINSHYVPLVSFQRPYMKAEQQSFLYLAASMFSNVQVNVQEHLCTKLTSFIKRRVSYRAFLRDGHRSQEEKEDFKSRVSAIISASLNKQIGELWTSQNNWTSDELILIKELDLLLETAPTTDKPLSYDVKACPESLLQLYIRLCALYALHDYPAFNAIPLRRQLVQSHVAFDNEILACIVLKTPLSERAKYDDDWIREHWGKVMSFGNPALRGRRTRGFKFSGFITTDGVSVSIRFKKALGNKFTSGKAKTKRPSERAKIDAMSDQYIDHHLDAITAGNYVCVDPNVRDLLYFQDRTGQTMRYTSMQRRKESKSKILKDRRKLPNSIQEAENRITPDSSCDPEAFGAHLQSLSATSLLRQAYYDMPMHLKHRWKVQINTQRSEARLCNRIRERFGNDVTVILGDWSKKDNPRYHAPFKTLGFRTMFKRHHIPCYLIDEYKTSKICPHCHNRLEATAIRRPSPRPWRQHLPARPIHGLLTCPSTFCKLEGGQRVWNRDVSATCNMLHIVDSMLRGYGRPLRFSRPVDAGLMIYQTF